MVETKWVCTNCGKADFRSEDEFNAHLLEEMKGNNTNPEIQIENKQINKKGFFEKIFKNRGEKMANEELTTEQKVSLFSERLDKLSLQLEQLAQNKVEQQEATTDLGIKDVEQQVPKEKVSKDIVYFRIGADLFKTNIGKLRETLSKDFQINDFSRIQED